MMLDDCIPLRDTAPLLISSPLLHALPASRSAIDPASGAGRMLRFQSREEARSVRLWIGHGRRSSVI